MSGFDAKEGLIHFLFAEPDDYYLESLLKLDLMQFLYYSIKSQEYDGIYFLKQENTVKTFLEVKKKFLYTVWIRSRWMSFRQRQDTLEARSPGQTLHRENTECTGSEAGKKS